MDLALRLDEDLLQVSRQRNDSRGLVLSYQSCGTGYGNRGRFTLSRSFLETALSLYDPKSHHSLGPQTGSYPHVVAEAYLGIDLLCLGFPDQALARSNAAIAEARRLAHSPTLASALMLDSIRLSIGGDNGDLDECVNELVALAADQGFPQWHAFGMIYRGWVKAKGRRETVERHGVALRRRHSLAVPCSRQGHSGRAVPWNPAQSRKKISGLASSSGTATVSMKAVIPDPLPKFFCPLRR
jgi:hypothetical protein